MSASVHHPASPEKPRMYVIEYSTTLSYKDIVNEILNGTHICLVDPVLYPQLESTIHDYLGAFRLQKDDYNAKKMEFCLDYIREEPNRQAVARMLTMVVRKPPVVPPVLSDEEVEAEVDFILARSQVRAYPDDELALVLEGLRRRRRQFIAEKRYLEANKAEHLAQVALSHGQLSAVEAIQESKRQGYQEMIDEQQRSLEALDSRWRELHANMRAAAQREFDEMEAQLNDRIAKLEISRATIPPSWAKFSAELLQLRRREEAMVKHRLFREAGAMKEHADALQRAEEDAYRRRWSAHIDQQIANARATYAKELQTRKTFWAGESTTMLDQAARETGLARRAIAHLQQSLRNAERAKELTCALKRENESRVGDSQGSVTGRVSARTRATEHGQRRILNRSIYTRTPTPGSRKRTLSRASETW
jgi:hypothetical protein